MLIVRDGSFVLSMPNERKAIDLEVTNLAPEFDQNLRSFQVLVSDEIGEIIPGTVPQVLREGCGPGSTTISLPPGEAKCVRTTIPNGFINGYLTQVRHLTVTLEPLVSAADSDRSNNWTRVRAGSDYVPEGINTIDNSAVEKLFLRGRVLNDIGGFPELKAVYLSRSTAWGVLSEIDGDAMDTLTGGLDARLRNTSSRLPSFPSGFLNYPAPGIPPAFELIELAGATEIAGFSDHYQVWFDSDGGLPELEGRLQIYMLVDSSDLAEELDETNNLMCINCVAPGQSPDEPGVIVRLLPDVPVTELFPEAYHAAALQLPAERPIIIDFRTAFVPRLPPRITPAEIEPSF
jgi:hypothetical protein